MIRYFQPLEWREKMVDAQFGPHRFNAGKGGGSETFRGARFGVADLRGARFTGYPDEERTGAECTRPGCSISGTAGRMRAFRGLGQTAWQ